MVGPALLIAQNPAAARLRAFQHSQPLLSMNCWISPKYCSRSWPLMVIVAELKSLVNLARIPLSLINRNIDGIWLSISAQVTILKVEGWLLNRSLVKVARILIIWALS